MTLKSTLTGLGCMLVLSLPALAQTKAANSADRVFIEMAAEADMTEAHIGQMAESQSSQSQIKDLAQKLIHDHTDAYQQLAALAGKTGDSIPTGIDVRKITAVEQLMKLKGARFDHQFVQEEIRDHAFVSVGCVERDLFLFPVVCLLNRFDNCVQLLSAATPSTRNWSRS